MKVGVLSLSLLKAMVLKDIKKRRLYYPPKDEFRKWINIPYLHDGNKQHTYDVYLADESNRKHCLFIDIHGGAYIFGEHQDNYPYAYVLLKAGFDVVLMDYEPNNGKKDISDIVNDVAANFRHLKEHLSNYDLDKDKVVITGDSAGGHLALLFSTALQSKEVREKLGVELPDLDPIATVVACPAYDFEVLGVGTLTNCGLKRMLGPKYKDREHLAKYSPKTYIEYHKVPLFLSTCKNDFVRGESMKLNEDMKDKPGYTLVDIQSDDEKVDHVHNVIKINLKESIEVNNAIVDFVDKLLK